MTESEVSRHEDGVDKNPNQSDGEVLEGEEFTDPEQRELISIVRREISTHHGPLPAPETLKAYGEIDPRFPQSIVTAFEEQSTHRREMERTLLNGSERRANRGQFLGTGLLLVAIGGGIWVTLAGQPVAGGILFTAALAVGALSYVFGDYRPNRGE